MLQPGKYACLGALRAGHSESCSYIWWRDVFDDNMWDNVKKEQEKEPTKRIKPNSFPSHPVTVPLLVILLLSLSEVIGIFVCAQ